MKIIINKPTKLILGIENQALIFSTNNLPGFDQMALDLNSLDQTISNPEIILTLRFYYWTGDWLSIGYHQKEIPLHWKNLLSNGEINIVRRPSGGGAVLHSGGITYALTFKKTYYKVLSYEMVNNWLIKSFRELGLNLQHGNLRKSPLTFNCFGTSLISDLVDQDDFLAVGQWVRHASWGKGQIVARDGQGENMKLEIRFGPHVKKVAVAFAQLEPA